MLTKEQIVEAVETIERQRAEVFPPVYQKEDIAQEDVKLNELTPIEGAPGSYRFMLHGKVITVKKAAGFSPTATAGDIYLCRAAQDITFKRLGKDVTIPMGSLAWRLFAKA